MAANDLAGNYVKGMANSNPYVMLCMRPASGARCPTMAPLPVQREPTVRYNSYPLSLLKHESAGVDCMHKASFITSSMVWLACCKILVPLQLMGWSSDQTCSVIADLSVWHLMQASLCSLSLVPRSLLVHMCMAPGSCSRGLLSCDAALAKAAG